MAINFCYKIHRVKVPWNRRCSGPYLLFTDLMANRTAILQRFDELRSANWLRSNVYIGFVWWNCLMRLIMFFTVIAKTTWTVQKNLYQEYQRQYLEQNLLVNYKSINQLSESKYSYECEWFCKFVDRIRPKLWAICF